MRRLLTMFTALAVFLPIFAALSVLLPPSAAAAPYILVDWGPKPHLIEVRPR